MKYTLSTVFLLLVLLVATSRCKKEEIPAPANSPGSFSATIDGTVWEPYSYHATYLPKMKRLYLIAEDQKARLLAGIQIDSLSPLKTYPLLPLGIEAVAELSQDVAYSSNQNAQDAGGTFQVLKFDTTSGKVSAVINFTGYSADRKKRVFATKTITDIELRRDTVSPAGNPASCTVTGLATTRWKTTETEAVVNCLVNGVPFGLRIEVPSILGGSTTARQCLIFEIPMTLKAGTYPVRPSLPPYSYCGNPEISCRYNLNDNDHGYFATSGSFTITSFDTSARKLTASFQVSVKDTTARSETIQLTNGQLKLNSWYKQ
ncbi:hypothetical protein [Flavisolibacter ginsenosidimutans]|uniref:Uncharacterized protein n=1 Tax=Flavisolibacter ginsenosidimutans TaxID=661481 RepID=A0A5B8UP09_9BACT|nr:hypothetical protein [Flavisolibacter ginsenosidimutans]QEC58374.1 hypothetical protein FSB75_21530 [Flavisolibacter ginsenosidimutans]